MEERSFRHEGGISAGEQEHFSAGEQEHFSAGGLQHYDQINQEYQENIIPSSVQHYEREPNANVERQMEQINQNYLNAMEDRGYYQQGGADLKQIQGLTKNQGGIQGNSFGDMEPKEQKEGLMDRSYGHQTHVYHDHMHNHTNEHDHEHKVTSSSS